MTVSQIGMLCLLIIMGMVTYFLGTGGDNGALAMAVGVLFGVLAGIPSLLTIWQRNIEIREQNDRSRRWADDGPLVILLPPSQAQPQRLEQPQVTINQTINNYYGDTTNNTVNALPGGAWPAVAERMAELDAQRRPQRALVDGQARR